MMRVDSSSSSSSMAAAAVAFREDKAPQSPWRPSG
jgi:hypothetical protein